MSATPNAKRTGSGESCAARAQRFTTAGRSRRFRRSLTSAFPGIATSKEYTLVQCLRTLSWDAALAVADSAMRAGESSLLCRVGASVRGPGAPQVRRAVAEARAEPANPFESVLRAIALDVDGLSVRQLYVRSVLVKLVARRTEVGCGCSCHA
jgi:hypothetical protein